MVAKVSFSSSPTSHNFKNLPRVMITLYRFSKRELLPIVDILQSQLTVYGLFYVSIKFIGLIAATN